MTMLDRMRRHKGWLKWSLAIVVLAFILLYIPSFLGNRTSEVASADVLVRVDGSDITVGEFRKMYQAQMQQYRAAYGGKINEQMLKQLGIDRQVLAQMETERAMMADAARRGITVTNDEVRQRILLLPYFQENGQFVGEARYRQILSLGNPPITPSEFEETVRRQLLEGKLRSAVTGWVSVSDADVQAEYARRNEKVKLEVVPILVDKLRSQVQVSDAEVASYFEAHKNDYKVGEKRKVRYLLVDIDAMRPRVNVTQREIQRFYDDNLDTYTTPEQVRASDILLKTGEDKDDAAVKAKADQVLKEARAPGADFAALAKKYSEDQATAKNGGDLDYFSKGRMLPEIEQAAFSMQPGQTSDVIKAQDGYHILKVTDRKAETTKTPEEVKPQITDQLLWQKAKDKASEIAFSLEKQIGSPADMDKMAAENGLKVQESAYIAREEPLMAIGASPELTAEIFSMADGKVSQALQTQRGWVFVTVAGRQAAHAPKLDEVREKVRDDAIRQKAVEIAQQKAAQVAAEASKGGDLQKAAKAAGLEAKTTELIAREQPIPDVGISPQVDAVAFALPAGAVSQPIKTDTAVVVVRVVEKKQPTPAEYAADRQKTREDLLNERRARFYNAYTQNVIQSMRASGTIVEYHEAIQKTIGS